MGYIAHDLAFVVTSQYRTGGLPDIEGFRQEMPEGLRHLLIHVPLMMNGSHFYGFLPDGSKEGWATSDEAEEWRVRFVDLFDAIGDQGAEVRFGGDFSVESDQPEVRVIRP
jgi:hypothetical protein